MKRGESEMTDDDVILDRIKKGKGLEPLQTRKNKR